MDFKKLYRRILPVSKEAFHIDSEQKNAELKQLNEKIAELQSTVLQALKRQTEYIELLQKQKEGLLQIESKTLGESEKLQKVIESKTVEESRKLQQLIEQTSLLIKNYDDPFSDLTKCIQQQTERLEKQEASIKKLEADLINIAKEAREGKRYAAEAVWSDVYHDTIINSTWLKKKAFSPGRWAIGYPVMYVLYRVLDEFRPHSILELGLGQSTKMISQYVASQEDVTHKVIEHDESWRDFFKNGNKLSDRTQIIQKKLTETELNGKEHIRCYEDFEEGIVPGKYDLIFIDAPVGGDMPDYARVDILKIVPEALQGDFVIILDDYNRVSEKNMINELKKKFGREKMLISSGVYEGYKNMIILTSEKWKFLCTL